VVLNDLTEFLTDVEMKSLKAKVVLEIKGKSRNLSKQWQVGDMMMYKFLPKGFQDSTFMKKIREEATRAFPESLEQGDFEHSRVRLIMLVFSLYFSFL